VWSFYVLPRFLKVTAICGLSGLRFETTGERGTTTKFENQLSVKKSQYDGWHRITFERHDDGMQLTTCVALCHGSASPQNWTREWFEMVNSLLCWRIRLIGQTRQICSTYHSYMRPVNGKTNYANSVALLQITHFLLQFALRTVAIGLQAAGRPFTASALLLLGGLVVSQVLAYFLFSF